MKPLKLQANGNPLVFTDQSVSYAGRELFYSNMSNVAHRGGEKPAFVFDYEGKRMALPYNPKDKGAITKVFQQVIIPQASKQGSPSVRASAKAAWSVGRLTIGIISMLLFIFITFQSCAAGFVNAVEANGSTSGSAGLFTGIMFLIAGIVGVCTKNTKGMVGPIITAVLYFIGAILTIGTGSTYGDLPIWGGLSAIFGIFFVACAIKSR